MAFIDDNNDHDDEEEITIVEVQLIAKFAYLDHNKNESTREVDVDYFEIMEGENGEQDIKFTGHCSQADDERSFRVSRIVGNVIVKGVNGVNSATKKEFDDLLRSISKSKNSDSKHAATGCLVVSIALIGTLTAVPIGVISVFI